jgi:hypothetical protein
VNTLYCLEEWRGKQIISPPVDNFTSRGQNLSLGDNFDAKFRMGLRVTPKSIKIGHSLFILVTLSSWGWFLTYLHPGTYIYRVSLSWECWTRLDLGIASGVPVIRWGDDD